MIKEADKLTNLEGMIYLSVSLTLQKLLEAKNQVVCKQAPVLGQCQAQGCMQETHSNVRSLPQLRGQQSLRPRLSDR